MTTQPSTNSAQPSINNDVYNELGDRWYEADDDPVALLRAEARHRTPWVVERLAALGPAKDCRVLDIGCGGGFLSNALAESSFQVTGIDVSKSSLDVAKRFDTTQSVRYLEGDAYELPFAENSFDAACALDFLEHVDDPGRVIAEAARVLRPGGLFFFYTFNRTLLSRLLVIDFVERFVKNVPPNLHLHSMFIKPDEMRGMCRAAGLSVEELVGVRPEVFSTEFLHLLRSGRVKPSFRFQFTRSTAVAYLGFGRLG